MFTLAEATVTRIHSIPGSFALWALCIDEFRIVRPTYIVFRDQGAGHLKTPIYRLPPALAPMGPRTSHRGRLDWLS